MPTPARHLLTRLRAARMPQVAAGTPDTYRAAGGEVYALFADAEQARAGSRAPSEAFLLCTWNAFALQTLGDALADADADAQRAGPATPAAAAHAHAFYAEVGPWLLRAREAQRDPGFRPDTRLPAALPGWVDPGTCTDAHLGALIIAGDVILDHAQLAAASLEKRKQIEVDPTALAKIHLVLTSVEERAHDAAGLHKRFRGGLADLHDRVLGTARSAVEGAYLLGQLAAQPTLIERLPRDVARGAGWS